MFSAFLCVVARIDLDHDFVCSQISILEINSTQSADYGVGVVDVEDYEGNNVVSMEGECSGINVYMQNSGVVKSQGGSRVTYDNVVHGLF